MAAVSLGRLTLDLLVNLGSFEQGMTAAERKTKQSTDSMKNAAKGFGDQLRESLSGTQIGGMIDSLTGKFGSLKGGIGVASAALAGMAVGGALVAVGVLSKIAIESAKADAQLLVLANRANTSVQSFQVLEHAAAGLGVTQDQLGSILADTQEKLGEFSATQGGGAADFFDALKNNTKMTDDQIKKFGKTLQGKDGVEAIQMIKDKMDSLGATSQEQRFVFESLASDLGNLMPLFAGGGSILKEYGDALKEAGIIKTKESIEQSRLLAAQTKSVQTRFDGLKGQLSGQMMPVLNSLLSHFLDGSKKGGQFGGVIQSVGMIAKGVGVVIIGVATSIQVLIKIISGMVDQAKNVAKTAVDVWNADGAKAKAQAMAQGFSTSFGLAKDTFTDGAAAIQKAIDGAGSVLDSAVPKLDKLGQLYYKTGDAANQSAKGIATDTKTAEENAKAKEKAAEAQENYNKMVGASALSGLRIKSGESIAGGQVRGYTAEFAKLTQEALGSSLNRFTAFNDTYHKGTGSKHAVGQAFDYTVKDASEADASIARLQAVAKKYGFVVKAINEYKNPSGRSTGGHVHVSVLGFKGTKEMAQEAQAELSLISQAKEDERRLREEKDRQQLEVQRSYFSEEQKMAYENEEAIKAIQVAYAGDKEAIAKYLALQKQAYDKDVSEFNLAQELKRIGEQKQLLEVKKGWMDAAEYARQYYAVVREEILANTRYSPEMKNAMIRQSDQQEGIDQYAKRDEVATAYNDRFGLQKSPYQQDMDLLNEANKQKLMLEEEYQQQRLVLQMQYGSQYGADFAGMMMGMVDQSSSAYAVLYGVQKAFNLASAIMSGYAAISAAWASAPFPYNLPAVAAATMETGVLQAAISAVSPVGMAHDGIDNIPKEGTWLLDKGERVVDSRTNADLKNYLANGGGTGGDVNITVNVTDSGVTTQSNQSDQKQLGQMIGNAVRTVIRQEQRQGGLLSK